MYIKRHFLTSRISHKRPFGPFVGINIINEPNGGGCIQLSLYIMHKYIYVIQTQSKIIYDFETFVCQTAFKDVTVASTSWIIYLVIEGLVQYRQQSGSFNASLLPVICDITFIQ